MCIKESHILLQEGFKQMTPQPVGHVLSNSGQQWYVAKCKPTLKPEKKIVIFKTRSRVVQKIQKKHDGSLLYNFLITTNFIYLPVRTVGQTAFGIDWSWRPEDITKWTKCIYRWAIHACLALKGCFLTTCKLDKVLFITENISKQSFGTCNM